MINGINSNLNISSTEDISTIINFLNADPLSRHSSITEEVVLYAMSGPERNKLNRELDTKLRDAIFIILVSNGDYVDLTYVQKRLWILEKGLELAFLRVNNINDSGLISTIKVISQEYRDYLLISAANRGNVRVVEFLLNNSTFDSNVGGQAFEQACEAGHLAVAIKLFTNRTLPQTSKVTAFEKAIEKNQHHIIHHFFPPVQSIQDLSLNSVRTFLPMQRSINSNTSKPVNESDDPLDIVLKGYRVAKL